MIKRSRLLTVVEKKYSRPEKLAKHAKPAVFGTGESIKHKFRDFQVNRFQNRYQSSKKHPKEAQVKSVMSYKVQDIAQKITALFNVGLLLISLK